jgi:hypothetical protein
MVVATNEALGAVKKDDDHPSCGRIAQFNMLSGHPSSTRH